MLYLADLAGSLPTPRGEGRGRRVGHLGERHHVAALEASRGKCNLENLFGPVDAILADKAWLLGSELSVAGRCVAS